MPNNTDKRRALGVDSALVLKFIATSFVYLLAGLILFAFSIFYILRINTDAVFFLWLFGSVTMIIFGLSYMFSSGLSRSGALINVTVSDEYYLLNAGVILFFIGFSGVLSGLAKLILTSAGLMAIAISVTVHLVNIILVSFVKRAPKEERTTFKDDY